MMQLIFVVVDDWFVLHFIRVLATLFCFVPLLAVCRKHVVIQHNCHYFRRVYFGQHFMGYLPTKLSSNLICIQNDFDECVFRREFQINIWYFTIVQNKQRSQFLSAKQHQIPFRTSGNTSHQLNKEQERERGGERKKGKTLVSMLLKGFVYNLKSWKISILPNPKIQQPKESG